MKRVPVFLTTTVQQLLRHIHPDLSRLSPACDLFSVGRKLVFALRITGLRLGDHQDRPYNGRIHLQTAIKRSIRQALDELASHPMKDKPLQEELAGLWSLRVSHYRIIYQLAVCAPRTVASGALV